MKTPPTSPENKLNVFCAFPINGATELRLDIHACGQISNDTTGRSRECQDQGINSLIKWILYYHGAGVSELMFTQCAFDMTVKTAAKDFKAAIAVKNYIARYWPNLANLNNELRIEAMHDGNCDEIPIETFFYLIDFPGADAKAANYRDLFYKRCGRKLPIVGLQLPTENRDLIIKTEEYLNH